jgi:predicted amidohydrolase
MCLTKFLYLGLPLDRVIECATAAPARAIGRPELGTLVPGSPADLAVFTIGNEPVEMWDTHYQRREWDRRIRVEATIRGGVVYQCEQLVQEEEEEITRRCRKRGPDALAQAWKTNLARHENQAARGGS